MPDLSQYLIEDLTGRLTRFLSSKDRNGVVQFLDAGGSAAVFKVGEGDSARAFKVFDPRFVSNETGSAERHRLSLQERLIGHQCASLVDTYSVEFAEGTAIVEMEFVGWSQLKKVLKEVPDAAVGGLISQLIGAVKFLEALNMVHRDIKPENIHVSPDYSRLKLLDLGVVREFDPGPDAVDTDNGNLRVFLATAQYSSPEYLFRLDEPSELLWKALNIYQVGAVLHDLIMKEPIFQSEISTGNRWLVAKSVLTKTPSFVDGYPERLIRFKALAQKSLTKDMAVRLKIICLDDFLDLENCALQNLKSRLKGRRSSVEVELQRASKFDREQFKEALAVNVRENLIAVCRTDLPLRVNNPISDEQCSDYLFDSGVGLTVGVRVILDWRDGVDLRTANVLICSAMQEDNLVLEFAGRSMSVACCANIDAGVQEAGQIICDAVAVIVSKGLDLIDGCGTDVDQLKSLVGADLLA